MLLFLQETETKLASTAEKFRKSSANLTSLNQQTREVEEKIESSKPILENLNKEIELLTVEQEKIKEALKAVKADSEKLTEEIKTSRAKLGLARKKYLKLEEIKMQRKDISVQVEFSKNYVPEFTPFHILFFTFRLQRKCLLCKT